MRGRLISDRPGPRLPHLVVATIGLFLDDPRIFFVLATLFAMPAIQVAAYRRMHHLEFDAAAAAGHLPLLDRLLAHCNRIGLAPRYSFRIVYDACVRGNMDILAWLSDSGLDLSEFRGSLEPIFNAALNGHVGALQWLRDNGWLFREEDAHVAIDYASMNGHVLVLQWWKDSGMPFNSDRALANAISYNRMAVLQWWKDSGLPIPYRVGTLDSADSVELLDWWRESGLDMHCSSAMDFASATCNMPVLEWWRASGLELQYSSNAMNWASENGHIYCLHWWKDSGFELRYTGLPYWKLQRDVMQWWINSGLPVEIEERRLVHASTQGMVEVLQLWKVSGLNVEYGERALNGALQSGNIKALQWWKESGLELKFSKSAVEALGKKSRARKWLSDNGLLETHLSSRSPLQMYKCVIGTCHLDFLTVPNPAENASHYTHIPPPVRLKTSLTPP
ncbi:hypothetical protein DFJ73DRAFT_866879 [Zopfochytrium polystomum]|nr:hypothetical protein DFJ73DRAFT_866879 [Zopfochytrium polystomum]